MFSCCPPPRLKLSCCCCGDMLSIQPPGVPPLTVQLSSGGAGLRPTPLLQPFFQRNKPSQLERVQKFTERLFSGAVNSECEKTECKQTGETHTPLVPSLLSGHWEAVQQRSSSRLLSDNPYLRRHFLRVFTHIPEAVPMRCKK